jgi:hypothetical protein
VADFKSESVADFDRNRWPTSNRNQWPASNRNGWPTSPGIRTLIACGPPHDPIVDLAGKDQVQYQRDLAACHIEAQSGGWGNVITKCMRRRGYTILVGY